MAPVTRREEIDTIRRQYPRQNFIMLGIIVLLSGILVGFHLVDIEFLDGDYPIGLYSELISIFITIFVLDQINDYRAMQRRKLELFRQVKSRSDDWAVDAIDQIQHEGWWNDLLEHYRNKDGQVDLGDVHWSGRVSLKNNSLKSANLWGANLKQAIFMNTSLQQANLQWANLQQTGLRWANMQEANLRWANLEKADLRESELQMTKMLNVNLNQANLRGANLEHTELRSANLELADLRDVKLRGANLRNAKLQGAKIMMADLVQTKLQDADLQNALLLRSNLQLADLWGADLKGALLFRANLAHVNFQDANLEQVNLLDANLTGATLQNAHMDNTTVLPDAKHTGYDDNNSPVYDKYWTPETDMSRYTNPDHPDFWQPDWVKDQDTD